MTDTIAAQTRRASLVSPLHTRQFLPALTLLFVGSGCAALIYEIVWLQMLQLVIGASAISLGVLLGTFMGGMCIGSLLFPRLVSRLRHPLRVYAMLELAIGIIGLLELKLVPGVRDLYTHVAATGMASIFLRAALAGVCLLPPTILMGATLPAIARWVEATPRGVSWLGFFYGGNIVGAVIGCLLAGFYLLRIYDMATATLWAVAINGTVAALAFLLSLIAEHRPHQDMSDEGSPIVQPDRWAIYVSIGLSGLTALGAEVVWTRLLSLMLGATVYTFSNILAVFLLGLGIGSSVGSFIARSVKRPQLALACCQFLLAGAVAWAAYAITFSIPFWPIDPPIALSPWYTFQVNLACCFWAVLPGAFLWGASFPLALASVASRGQDPGKMVGGLYAANTVGAIIGSLAFTMFLIPAVGTQGAQRLLLTLCAISGTVAIIPLFSAAKSPGIRADDEDSPSVVAMAIGVVAAIVGSCLLWMIIAPPNVAAVAWGRNSAYYMNDFYPSQLTEEEITLVREANGRGLRSMKLDKGKLVFDQIPEIADAARADNKAWVAAYEGKLTTALQKREAITGKGNVMAYGDEKVPNRYVAYIGEGMNVSVAVTFDEAGYRYFHGAGKVQASSKPEDMRLQRTLGHITALTKRDPEDVLVVACGAGVTAGSFVPYKSVKSITIVDIERLVPTNVTKPFFGPSNHHVMEDPRTHLVIDDGRHFVETTNQKFDIITSDPIDPWVKGCAALNTVEYYRMCREHLKPGGVMALWIPLYESSEDTAKSVIATFFQAFPQGIIWSNDIGGQGYDAVLFGTVPEKAGEPDQPLKINIDDWQAYLDDPAHDAVKQSLRDVGYGTAQTPGSCEAVELLATYAGTGPRMKEWTKGTEDLLNWDRNLRLQYVAGLWINNRDEVKIFNGILKNYSFPTEIFSGSPERIAALKTILEQTGRIERN